MSRFLAFLCGALVAATPVLSQSTPKFGKWGVDLASLDASVKPGDNFFLHVNGGWLKTAQIPADRSSTGSFQDLQILSEERLKTIVADLEQTPAQQLTEEGRKLRDLYDAFVDTDAIEARGLSPAKADLDYLEHLKTLDDVAHAMGSIRLSTMSVFNIGIGVDDKHPDNYSVNLGQSGLGMPDRDYYLSDDPQIVKTREAYRKYLADMMTLAGFSSCALLSVPCTSWQEKHVMPCEYIALCTKSLPCMRFLCAVPSAKCVKVVSPSLCSSSCQKSRRFLPGS